MWPPYAFLGILLPIVVNSNSVNAIHRRQNTSVTLITGIQTRTPDGNYHTRREIRDLQANSPDLWNLYLLGLRSFQAADQNGPLSYYQIAGIHGRPHSVWQNAEGIPGKKGGYCPHLNTMFFGWHRPYVALFEQELYKHIQNVAAQFPPSIVERYTTAAQEFRAPYWDWALGPKGGDIPGFLLAPTIQVTDIDGTNKTIPNPLERYRFHPLIPADFDKEFATWNSTIRQPTTRQPDAVSQNEKVAEDFNQLKESYVRNVHESFALRNGSMNAFSADIENIHGYIHFAFGIGSRDAPQGHMWPAEYSAFDPVFWLHHSNVDRLFALYQAIYPDRYFLPARAGSENVWIQPDEILTADTPLKPFWRSPTQFWTTNDIKDTKTLGYVYPETQSWKFESQYEYQRTVMETVARLYPSPMRSMLAGGEGEPEQGAFQHLLVDNIYVDWQVRIQAGVGGISGPFVMGFYLDGDLIGEGMRVNEEVEVGAWTVLMAAMDPADSRVQIQNVEELPKFSGTVSLTASLLDEVAAGRLASLDKEDVVPLLGGRLSWRLRMGEEYFSPANDLSIEVFSTHVRIPDDPGQFLQYNEDWTLHPEVVVREKLSLVE